DAGVMGQRAAGLYGNARAAGRVLRTRSRQESVRGWSRFRRSEGRGALTSHRPTAVWSAGFDRSRKHENHENTKKKTFSRRDRKARREARATAAGAAGRERDAKRLTNANTLAIPCLCLCLRGAFSSRRPLRGRRALSLFRGLRGLVSFLCFVCFVVEALSLRVLRPLRLS